MTSAALTSAGETPIGTLKIRLQVYRGTEIAIGPGKAALLDAIARDGSIAAAARGLGMSYRRAWMLVDTMNRCFRKALVETTPGGGARAGARVTAAGRTALTVYRDMERRAAAGTQPAFGDINRLLNGRSR